MSARGSRWLPALAVMVVASAAALLLSLRLGPSSLTWSDLVGAITGELDETARSILLDVRLPRVLMAALVGAGLSAAGATFQAVLRNPLADPYVLGVSGGAALGAVLFTVLMAGDPMQASVTRPLAAFAGALASLAFLFAMARAGGGRTGSVTLLLVGVVLNAFESAVILFLVTAGDPARFQGMFSYLIGAVPVPAWQTVAAAALLVAAGLVPLFLLSHRLNLLALGEEAAAHLGVDVERTIWAAVAAASLVTAGAVAFCGIVGFVGLIVPHAVRAAFGPDHRLLIPASAVAGAGFLAIADAAARTVLAPVELPVGVITAVIGGPFFLALFWRRLRESAS